jgi:putative flippase GtrA
VSSLQPETLLAEPWRLKALRLGRSLIVGSGGTALDFAALTVSIRLLHIDATWARIIGLCVGGVVLFFGSRSFAFRAQAEAAGSQAKRFFISELIGFPLNMLAFKLALQLLPAVAPELLSLLANFVLFVAYYYPVRSNVVFRVNRRLVVQAATARL